MYHLQQSSCLGCSELCCALLRLFSTGIQCYCFARSCSYRNKSVCWQGFCWVQSLSEIWLYEVVNFLLFNLIFWRKTLVQGKENVASPSRSPIRDLDLVTGCSMLLLVRTVVYEDLKSIAVGKYKEGASVNNNRQQPIAFKKQKQCLCQPTPSKIKSQQGEFNPRLFYDGLTKSCDLPLWC